jgi:hypothetical protein
MPPIAGDCVLSNGRAISSVHGSGRGLTYSSVRALGNERLQAEQPISELLQTNSNEHSGFIKDEKVLPTSTRSCAGRVAPCGVREQIRELRFTKETDYAAVFIPDIKKLTCWSQRFSQRY